MVRDGDWVEDYAHEAADHGSNNRYPEVVVSVCEHFGAKQNPGEDARCKVTRRVYRAATIVAECQALAQIWIWTFWNWEKKKKKTLNNLPIAMTTNPMRMQAPSCVSLSFRLSPTARRITMSKQVDITWSPNKFIALISTDPFGMVTKTLANSSLVFKLTFA